MLRADGKTVFSYLESLYRRYGLFVSSQVNLTKPGAQGAQEIRALMERLRKSQPRHFGTFGVSVSCHFCATSTESTSVSGSADRLARTSSSAAGTYSGRAMLSRRS